MIDQENIEPGRGAGPPDVVDPRSRIGRRRADGVAGRRQRQAIGLGEVAGREVCSSGAAGAQGVVGAPVGGAVQALGEHQRLDLQRRPREIGDGRRGGAQAGGGIQQAP